MVEHWSHNDTMTWDETFAAIRGGDIGCIIAFSIECLIMASPVVLVVGAYYFGK